MAILNVNTDQSIILTNKLERLNKSAFPIAVKNTLNDLAFQMKKTEIVKSAKSSGMQVRSKTFFSRFTTVEKANGYNVNTMVSTVGWVSRGQNSETAVKGIEKQEYGGTEKKGSRYLSSTRGGNYSKLVKRGNLFNRSKVLDGKRYGRVSSSKSRNVAKLYLSAKENKSFFIETKKGTMLIQATSFSNKKGRIKAKTKALMLSRSKQPANIKATNFMGKASKQTSLKVYDFYEKNANYQFKRALI